MKLRKRIIAALLGLSAAAASISGCGAFGKGNSEAQNTAPEYEAPELESETDTVKLALNGNGHVLSAIAMQEGYFADEGIEVIYVEAATDAEVFEGIYNGTIDVAASSGTNLPLQEIANGMDLTIFGGYLLTGCMPVFARTETRWHGLDDLIGKTVAWEPNLYAVSGPLLDMGYDPLNDITWLETEDQMDRIKAVKDGTADFGLVGTALNYEINQDPELKIITYAADVLPDYSCCRAEARTEWVEKNPGTIKALLKAWIRAMAYYDSHHDETAALVAGITNTSEEAVRAYLDNPRFALNPDPMKSSVERAWDYMGRLGLFNEEAKQINIDDHINTELYKMALDECQAQYGSENPKFYEKLQTQYARFDR